MKTIIAIDPGKSGGIAVCWGAKPLTSTCEAMPDTDGDTLAVIAEIAKLSREEGSEPVCFLEQVGGFTGKGQPGSAMFKFGEGFGFLKGALMALGVRIELVRPQVWQKTLGLGKASECASKTVWKNKLKAEAQRRYPGLKVTLATADALLILEHAKKQN